MSDVATMLLLRTCSAELTSYSGFEWPESGPVEAPDWDPSPCCGGGLHGLPWGEGNGSLLDWGVDAKWLVWEAIASDVVEITEDGGGKSKAPRGVVVYCGDREGATRYIAEHGGSGRSIVGGTATAGDFGTATAGDFGTATAGDRGTATAGDRGTATAGYLGTATAGDLGTATAGYLGTATAGYRGTATAGYRGTATAGDFGTATAGYLGTATAGENGVLSVEWYDEVRNCYRRAVGVVGENGLKPNVPYRLDGKGQWVEAETKAE